MLFLHAPVVNDAVYCHKVLTCVIFSAPHYQNLQPQPLRFYTFDPDFLITVIASAADPVVAALYELIKAFLDAGCQAQRQVLDPTPLMRALVQHGFRRGALSPLALELASTGCICTNDK